MLKLMKLELRKIKFGSYIRNIMIANILLSLWCVTNIPDEWILDYRSAFAEINTYVRTTFIVFASVLMSRIIIDEYRNQVISVLFTYPISRRKLFAAKLMLIAMFTMVTIIVSNLLVLTVFILMDSYYQYIPDVLTTALLIDEVGTMLIVAVASAGISLIPLIFGMIRKSVPITIITSFMIALALTGFKSSTLSDHWMKAILIALALLAFGIALCYLVIRRIERVDVNG